MSIEVQVRVHRSEARGASEPGEKAYIRFCRSLGALVVRIDGYRKIISGILSEGEKRKTIAITRRIVTLETVL